MRNTLQYPVTKQEVLRSLEQAFNDEMAKGLIGGITPLAIRKAMEFIEEHGPDYFYETLDPRSKDQ